MGVRCVHMKGRAMNRMVRILFTALICFPAYGGIRTWTLVSGQSVEGEYVKVVISNVIVKNAEGRELRLPLTQLSTEDQSYVQLENPPELKVDMLEGFRQDDPRTSIIWEDNSLVTGLYYKFGARVKQQNLAAYDHDLKFVIYELAQQIYDPDKYHIMARIESAPFRLTEENEYRYEFRDDNEYRVLKWVLGGTLPRGQKMAESVVLVYDERGEIIAYNSSKKWLYKNLDKLQKLPVGAWIDDKCNRVHPTCPRREES